MHTNLSVLIADDHHVITDALSAFLTINSAMQVQTAHSLEDAIQKIRQNHFDIAMIDYRMPGVVNTNFVTQLKEANSDLKVAAFSGAIDDATAMQIIEAGAKGYIPKSVPAASIANILGLVHSGEIFLPSSLLRYANERQQRAGSLTELEHHITQMLAIGAVNKEIARKLKLSEASVKMHVRNIFNKLGVRNRTEAALKAQQLGISP